MSNIFKTTLLLTVMTLLLMLAGRAFGGENGMFLALIFAGIMNFVSYFFSDKIALAMYRAQPVTREQLPRVYNIVERLSQKVGLADAQGLRHSEPIPRTPSPPDAIQTTRQSQSRKAFSAC